MDYNYNAKRTSKKGCFIFVGIVIIFFGIVAIYNWLSNLFATTYYFNEPFEYNELEIIVTEVKEIDLENGSFEETISFSAKNIGENTNSFDLDDVYLVNENTKEEYPQAELFSHENLESGETKEYEIRFTLPSSISSEKYILCFDFDSDSIGKCALYYENGEMLTIETFKLYYDHNIQTLSSHFGDGLAAEILSSLEGTNVIKSRTQINSDWIVKRDENVFELYNGFSVIIFVANDQFKIYTFETIYDENTAILLYDSKNPDGIKVLDDTEKENLRYAQRKYQVQSVVEISPRFGVLLHNKLGQTFFSFTVKNVGDSEIVYMELKITPSFPGYESDTNKKSYSSFDEIGIGKSQKIELKTTDWTNYDFFEITSVVLYFNDGTSIGFDEYDCQFLSE